MFMREKEDQFNVMRSIQKKSELTQERACTKTKRELRKNKLLFNSS